MAYDYRTNYNLVLYVLYTLHDWSQMESVLLIEFGKVCFSRAISYAEFVIVEYGKIVV